jgi:hypothetical protein
MGRIQICRREQVLRGRWVFEKTSGGKSIRGGELLLSVDRGPWFGCGCGVQYIPHVCSSRIDLLITTFCIEVLV